LSKVIKSSGNEVEPYWPMLFAKALKSADVNELLTNIASAPAAGAGPAAAAAEVVADKVEEKVEVEVVDMGGLFGDDDEY
jgi:large subunit ribosomal protein LP1